MNEKLFHFFQLNRFLALFHPSRSLFPPFPKRARLSPLWQPTRLPLGGGRLPQQQQQPPLEQQRQAASSTWSRSRSLSKRREPHRPPCRRATSSSEPGPQRRSSSKLQGCRRHSRPTTSSIVRPPLAKGAGAETGSLRPTLRDTVPCRGAPTGGEPGTRAPPRPSSRALLTRGRRSWAAASKCSAARPCR